MRQFFPIVIILEMYQGNWQRKLNIQLTKQRLTISMLVILQELRKLEMINKQPEGFAPGIYYNMSSEDYHADPALSSSGLKKLLKNPMEYWDSSPLNPDREQIDTIALKNGRAFHTMLLEPEKFNNEFEIKPNVKTTTVKGMIGAGDYQDMLNAAKVINKSPLLSKLCAGGKPEVSIFWRDAETQIMCRVRFDYLTPQWGVDYKTTTDVSKDKLAYTVADYGYHISAAMYLEGMRNASEDLGGHNNFILLFQNKKRPYTPRALRIDDPLLEIGLSHFRRGLQIYRENIDRYGIAPWSAGYEGVEDLTIDDMPFKYKQ